MKTKKWITIGLISLALLIASVVLLFVLVLPGIKYNKAMKALEEGDKSDAAELFSQMSRDKVDSFKDDVKDLIVYKANQCIKSEISYEDFFEVMEAVEEISSFNGMTVDALKAVNAPRMKQLYLDGVAEHKKNSNSDAYRKIRDEFKDLKDASWDDSLPLRYSWSEAEVKSYDSTVTDPLEAEMKSQYEAYNAGTIDYDTMNAYAETAEDFWYSDEAYKIRSEMYYDKIFKEYLDEAKEEFDKEDYWDCIRSIDSTRSWYGEEDVFSKWKSQFDTLYEEAENKAKTYYVDKAIEAAKDGDTYEVESIVGKLKEHFGDDFDTSAIEENLHSEWQKAYVEFFASDWKAQIKKEIDALEDGNDLFGLKSMDVDKDLPSKMFLKDLDGDGVPEVLLADSKYMVVITYYNRSVRICGILQWKGLGDGSKIISAGDMKYEGIDIKITLLTELKNGQLDYLKMAAVGTQDGQVVHGLAENGSGLEQVDEETYNAAVESITAEIKSTALSGGANLADYEKYIYSYKAE